VKLQQQAQETPAAAEAVLLDSNGFIEKQPLPRNSKPRHSNSTKKAHSRKKSITATQLSSAHQTNLVDSDRLKTAAAASAGRGGGGATSSGSVYMDKKKNSLISLPKNPFGFDSTLASQVASKAKLLKGFTKKKTEEVFGDSSE